VAVYRRRIGASAVSPALGARLGLISGAIGFVFFAIVGSLQLLFSNAGHGLREEVMKQLEQVAAQYPAQAQQALEYLKSAQGWGFIVALSTVFTLLMFLLLSTIGGAVGGAMLSRKDRKF
jgi:ABC-type antimicrobial peptide transport system permease subunit